MSNSGPPQAVRRFLRRPLVWAMVGAGFGVFLFGLDLHAARTEERDLRDALRLTGTVDGSYRRGTTVPVRYFNPVTEQEVLVEVYLWREDLRPDRPGETVPLRVSPDDPDVVTVAGDRFPLFHNVVGYLPFVLVPVAVAVTRRLGISRSRRLAASPGATFAMLGSVSPRGRFSRRQDLQLYPLDAPPGAPPACAVPLVSARCLPAKVTVFPVEVKGEPRSFGRVVVRVGDEVLWPAGRALVTRRVPRPARFTDVAALRARPAPEPPAAESPDFWPVAGLAVVVASAAAALLAVVSVVTLAAAADAADVAEEGARAVATVVGRDDLEGTLDLQLPDPSGGGTRVVEVGVDYPLDYTEGRRYPVRVDRRQPDRVQLAAEPYDAVEPIGWGASPLALALLLLSRRVALFRSQRQALRDGPFWIGEWRISEDRFPGHRRALSFRGGAPGAGIRVEGEPSQEGAVTLAGSLDAGLAVALVTDGVAQPAVSWLLPASRVDVETSTVASRYPPPPAQGPPGWSTDGR